VKHPKPNDPFRPESLPVLSRQEGFAEPKSQPEPFSTPVLFLTAPERKRFGHSPLYQVAGHAGTTMN